MQLSDGTVLQGKGSRVQVPEGQRVRLTLPGGGGYGDVEERDRAKVMNDVRNGYISLDAARGVYGIDV
ncbi:hypothetical protein [Paenalcaligenes niemegkensis]|uniref:hypothetical protein n=1 Tax=Paenalcaligenes niemegkensis TaxID=2895469 RepID=UPI0027E33E03|nr:hypothetical protein [Paenalcaligenes niemegkensis]